MIGTTKMVQAKANANFYSLYGSSSPENFTPLYKEYRRCWMEYPSRFVVRDFPIHLDIEASSRCNLRCTFCDKLPILSRDQIGDMDIRLYRKILDEAGEKGLWGLKLSYRGEPLLHPRIAEMVEYAKKRGVLDIYMNSNKLMDAALDRISISVEGIDPVKFEQDRVGAKFDRILKNIEILMNLKAIRGSAIPKIRVQTVCLPHVDLDEYTEFWKSRCDEVAAVDYKDVVHRNEDITRSDWACPQLWQRMTIEWDGTVMACNNDDFRRLSLGNVYNRDIYSCWHDPLVQKARELHMNGKSDLLEACRGCPWRTTQIQKNG
jgi:radical SAM protein with 4Fe4S-binding SPASM domain